MIKRCIGMRKHQKRGNGYDQHRKLELDPPEKNTRMKNDELENVEHLHGKSPDKNIDRKEWRNFTKNKRILGKEILVLEEKGWVGGKKQRQLGQMEWIPLRKLRIDLANVGMTGCT